jgi:hypothetical protein
VKNASKGGLTHITNTVKNSNHNIFIMNTPHSKEIIHLRFSGTVPKVRLTFRTDFVPDMFNKLIQFEK